MLTKTNICSVQNCLGGNTDHQQFENKIQNADIAPTPKTPERNERNSADARE